MVGSDRYHELTGYNGYENELYVTLNIIMIAEIRYRDAHPNFLPRVHRWWKRDEQGNLIKEWGEGGFICLDFAGPQFRSHVAQPATRVSL